MRAAPAREDYASAYREFSLEKLEGEILDGSLERLNGCVECCDRWADGDRVAIEWFGIDGARQSISYAALRDKAARFADVLAQRGIGRGDVVAGLLPRIPDLFAAVLGTWRAGAIYQPLFTAFGPAAIESRVTAAGGSEAKLIVTDAANGPKLDGVPNCPPILLVGTELDAALAAASHDFTPVALTGRDPFCVLFTSGTTGKPKGVRWPLAILLPVGLYMRDAIELRPDDSYWNVADPGWAYGMLYAVMGPLLLGATTTFHEGPFTVESTLRVLQARKITNLAAAPTAYRLLMAAGDGAVAPVGQQLRVASSAGEPLNPEVIRWAQRALGVPLNDHYGQTELAMFVNNFHRLTHAIKPGSAGVTQPGFTAAILDDDLQEVPRGKPGVLAIRRDSPTFCFEGYWKAETPALRGDWYITGDTMLQDEDGYFFFVGRNDDIITSAGYRIGPFDVESVIMEHPEVAEVAVIGKPDPERTEVVQAFVVLKTGNEPSDQLADDIRQLVRKRLSTHAYPRLVEFVEALPKTPSGKVQRFLLRQRG